MYLEKKFVINKELFEAGFRFQATGISNSITHSQATSPTLLKWRSLIQTLETR